MRYKSTHTYMIDFAKIDHKKLFAELDLFQVGWPTVKVEVGTNVVSISHRDRLIAEGSADMLYLRLRSMEWFNE